MHDETNQTLQRQWAMLRAIPRWPQKITVTAMMEVLRDQGFEPSRRTVERDLHELCRRFPLFLDDTRRPQGWSWMKDAQLEFLPGLTTAQCLALALARHHMTHLLPQSMLDDLAPLFDAAEGELAKTGWKDWHKRIAVVPPAFVLQPPKIDAKVLDDVQRATARRLRMTAMYRSKGQALPKRREIHPLGLLVRGSVQYLVCLLPEYEKPRQLAVHRMRDTVVSDQRCKELPGFSMRRYAANDLAIESHGRIRLRARVDTLAAEHLGETPLSKYQTFLPIAGAGKVEICATVDDDLQLKRYLLSFGSELEVLEPERLRKDLVDEMRKALEAYAPC